MRCRIPPGILVIVFLPVLARGQCFGQAAGEFRLAGQVKDSETRMEVASALVKLEGRMGRHQAVTNSRGLFEFSCLGPDSYTLEISRDGYYTTRVQVSLLSASIPDMIVEIEPTMETVTKPATAYISVRQAQIPEEAKKYFDKGVKELHAEKDPGSSVQHFQKAVEIYGDYDEAYVQLGIAYTQLSQDGEAEKILKKALQIHPRNVRAHIFLGKLYYRQEKFENAIAELQEAVEVDGTLGVVHLELGRLLSRQRKFEEALRHALLAHQFTEEIPDVHLFLYNAYINVKQYKAALAELDEFVRRYPERDAAKRLLAIRDRLREEVEKDP